MEEEEDHEDEEDELEIIDRSSIEEGDDSWEVFSEDTISDDEIIEFFVQHPERRKNELITAR